MSVEFVDTNVLVYAHEGGAAKHQTAVRLLERLFEEDCGAISIQVLCEFYAAATRKLGMKSEEAEDSIMDLRTWIIHRPGHEDIIRAARLHRRYKLGWWDAMIINSAVDLGCSVLWSEDLNHGQRYGSLIVRNPFA